VFAVDRYAYFSHVKSLCLAFSCIPCW
jgi:hypothetical protein